LLKVLMSVFETAKWALENVEEYRIVEDDP